MVTRKRGKMVSRRVRPAASVIRSPTLSEWTAKSLDRFLRALSVGGVAMAERMQWLIEMRLKSSGHGATFQKKRVLLIEIAPACILDGVPMIGVCGRSFAAGLVTEAGYGVITKMIKIICRNLNRSSPTGKSLPTVSTTDSLMTTPVQLYVYDLSNGIARQMSRQLTGRQIDGIW